MADVTELLAELVAIPSVNPAFLPARHPHAGEGDVAEFLAGRSRRARLDVEFQPILPGRRNVLARLRPGGKVRQTILLAPHLDTVNVVNGAQVKAVKRNGRI